MAAAVATLLVVLLGAGCGDEDSEPSSRTAAPTEQSRSQDTAERPAPSDEGGPSPDGGGNGAPADEAPVRSHEDSGGGVEQFLGPQGSDNSVQEFGSEASDAEFEEAAAVLHAFLDARAAGDWEGACEQLATSTAEAFDEFAEKLPQFKGSGCADVLESLSGRVPESELKRTAVADVGALRVEGDQAFLLYHGVAGVDYAITMVQEDGRWKVASMAGVPLPN
jgi:hypothetical protein